MSVDDAARAPTGVTARQRALLGLIYDAFNERDIEAVLVALTDDVSWPDSRGGTLAGREAVRRHWEDLWRDLVVHLQLLGVTVVPSGDVVAQVHATVFNSTRGSLVADRILRHAYRFRDGLVASMDAAVLASSSIPAASSDA